MHVLDLLLTQVRANRLANHRLLAALAPLGEAEFAAPRVGFFPSLALTLNHVLAVDIYYIDALHGRTDMQARYRALRPCRTVAALGEQQAASDERLIAFCAALRPGDELRDIALDRGREIEHSPLAYVLQHLLMHQTHHRGQAHAMLSSTAIAPPQLDEFLMPSDAAMHRADLAAVGWPADALFAGMQTA